MNKVLRVLREPVLLGHLLDPFRSAAAALGLHIMAWWNGGRCSLASNVRFHHPVVFQGRGRLAVSNGVVFGFRMAGALTAPILLQPREREAVIRIGERTSIMNGCELISRSAITVGSDCLFGPHTIVYDADFHGVAPGRRGDNGGTRPVTIGDNVWVGTRVLILKGVSIGRDAVVAAGSVVTKNVAAGAIAAGNPARQVGSVYD